MARERCEAELATAPGDPARDTKSQIPSFQPGAPIDAAAALRLQRTAGNAAVARLVAARREAPASGLRTGRPAGQGPWRSFEPRSGTAVRRLQRAGAAAKRGASGKRAPDCPGYGPGEITRSRTEAGILIDDVGRLPGHLLIADFGVDQSKLKGTVKRDRLLLQMLAEFERDQDWVLTILGLDDCVGAPAARERLRDARAAEVFKLLGPSARARVTFVGAAAPDMFHSDNRSSGGRALNRGALIGFNQDMDIQAEKIEVKVSRPRRGTVDCTTAQKTDLEKAHPLAVSMARRAHQLVHGRPIPAVAQLLRKYFHDDGDRTVDRVRAGFGRVVSGLTATTLGAKYECEEEPVQWQIPGLPSCDDPDTQAYATPWVGFRIHVCEKAFTTKGGIVELAATLLHEHSHLYDGTQFLKKDEPYCGPRPSAPGGGCPPDLSPSEAINTADAYSEFAKEAHILGL